MRMRTINLNFCINFFRIIILYDCNIKLMKFAILSQTRTSSTKNVKDILSKRIRRLMRDNVNSLKMELM